MGYLDRKRKWPVLNKMSSSTRVAVSLIKGGRPGPGRCGSGFDEEQAAVVGITQDLVGVIVLKAERTGHHYFCVPCYTEDSKNEEWWRKPKKKKN